MEMLTKYIILVDSAIPLSEKQCFLTFSITGSLHTNAEPTWTRIERAKEELRKKNTDQTTEREALRTKFTANKIDC